MKSTAFSAALLSAILADATITSFGGITLDGTNVWFNLHTAWPGRGGNGNTNQAAYAGFAREAVARGTGEFTVTGNDIAIDNPIEFPSRTTTGSAESCYFWSITVAASGTSAILWMGTIGGAAPEPFVAGTDNVIQAKAHGLANDERVVLWDDTDGVSYPTGLTSGTVYYVINSATDAFEVSTTQGGGAVDITAAGGGRWQKCVPLVTQFTGDTPRLTALTISES